MRIRYNGHSCFSVFAEDGTCIVMDPYLSGAFGGAIGYHPIDSVPDVVLISHNHPDHAHTAQFKNQFETLRDSGTAKGIKFQAISAFHDRNKGVDRGKIKIFKFTVDGVKLCHLGDLGQILSDELVKEIGEVDVLFVPVGGFYTIDALEARDAVEKIRPKIAIPMHYKTDRCGMDIAPVSEFTQDRPEVKVIDNDEIELFSDRLPGMTEILVLKCRL